MALFTRPRVSAIYTAHTNPTPPDKIFVPVKGTVAKPNASIHVLQRAVSLGGRVSHLAHPPTAEHNLLGSLPVPARRRTLGGNK